MYLRAIQPCRSLIKDMIFISKNAETVNGGMRQTGSLKAYKGEKTETLRSLRIWMVRCECTDVYADVFGGHFL